MNSLFESAIDIKNEPLAARMRPRNLDEYVGQEHILGKGCLLRRAIKADRLSSIILYGPPGTGKTTLARVIAQHTKSSFVNINAVFSGIQQIRTAIAAAEERKNLYGKKTILFVDEVHRWNKAQQDALLPWVENGTVILIGATTENPFFEVNNALVSRSRIFQLQSLQDTDLYRIANMALSDTERGYGNKKITVQKDALAHLVCAASGDARNLLNAIELAVETSGANSDGEIIIDLATAEESIQTRAVLYDSDGDYHYDVISAFIKSIRGSDPNAALYWLAYMVAAGENPRFIFRRLLISACEDVGLACPNAISVVHACAEAFERIGMPEGQYHLAHATLYLATAPKSNSNTAFFDALTCVKNKMAEVPNHLKDSSRDVKQFGHGAGYVYPHAYQEHWVPQQYLPDALLGTVFYRPSTQGYENYIRQTVQERYEAQLAYLQTQTEPFFTDIDRDIILPSLKRSDRVLLYMPKKVRTVQITNEHVADGCTAILCKDKKSAEVFQGYVQNLDFFSAPVVKIMPTNKNDPLFADIDFDYMIAENPARIVSDLDDFFSIFQKIKSASTELFFSQIMPHRAFRFSQLLEKTELPLAALEQFTFAENQFFADVHNEYVNWDSTSVHTVAKAAQIHLFEKEIEIELIRRFSKKQIAHWFSEESVYGRELLKHVPSFKTLLPYVFTLADKTHCMRTYISLFSTQQSFALA